MGTTMKKTLYDICSEFENLADRVKQDEKDLSDVLYELRGMRSQCGDIVTTGGEEEELKRHIMDVLSEVTRKAECIL